MSSRNNNNNNNNNNMFRSPAIPSLRYTPRRCKCNKSALILVTKTNANGNKGCLIVVCPDSECKFFDWFEPDNFEPLEHEHGETSSASSIGRNDPYKRMEKLLIKMEDGQKKMHSQQVFFMFFVAFIVCVSFMSGRV